MEIEQEHEVLEPIPKSTAEIVAEKNAEIENLQSKISYLEGQLSASKNMFTMANDDATQLRKDIVTGKNENKTTTIKLNFLQDQYDDLLEKLIDKI